LAALALLLVGTSSAQTPDETAPSVVTRAPSADGAGTAAFTTPHLRVGLTETFGLVYTATATMAVGGGIRVVDPDFHGAGWAQWQEFQTVASAGSGYLSVASTNSNATLVISRAQATSHYDQSYTTILVSAGELSASDVVTMCFANALTPHRAYQGVEWHTLTDADGDGTFAPIGVQPRLSILPDPTPALMVATGPTYVQVRAPFTLTVRVLDKLGNPCVDFADTLTFTSTDALADLGSNPSPFPSGSGVREFSVTLHTPGIQYVYVDGASALHTESNPLVVVTSLAGQARIFWGDLHGHHGHVYTSSQGQRVDEYMAYARDVSDLDFACESAKSSGYFNVAEAQAEVEASVIQYNDPGRFVTFRGYEWIGAPTSQGHHNPYFSGPAAGPVYSANDPASDTLDELWELLEATTPPGEQAITPPHALCVSGSNWHDIEEPTLSQHYRPLVEIYSLWGSSERGCDGSARGALVYGHRVGFYGSSDTHSALPGNPQRQWFALENRFGGLAAVYAEALTREALWEGLTRRRTYATEGTRIFLDFTVNGYSMGSEISSTVAPHIVVTAAGTAPISQVLVFKGTYLTDTARLGPINDCYTTVYSVTTRTWTTSFSFTDTAFNASAFYYLRVTQTDGRRAWSSPIWVDYGSPYRVHLPIILKNWLQVNQADQGAAKARER
jgi:hypothetical protein